MRELLRTIFDDFLAGWAGGVAGLIVGHPADTIKVRQQTVREKFWTTVFNTYKYEGIRGYYKGFMVPFFTIGPSNAVFFSTYGSCLRFLQQDNTSGRVDLSNPHWRRNTCYAGFVAGFVQVMVTCPVELIKTVMQTNIKLGGKQVWNTQNKVIYKSTTHAFLSIIKANGVRGLYKGLVPMLWRDVPASSVYTLIYEMGTPRGPTHPLWQQISAGGIAGICSWLLTLPFDVIKSRMQSDSQISPMYKGLMDCIHKSYKAEGFQVFYRGFWLITLRAFPVNAAILLGYEKMSRVLKENKKENKS